MSDVVLSIVIDHIDQLVLLYLMLLIAKIRVRTTSVNRQRVHVTRLVVRDEVWLHRVFAQDVYRTKFTTFNERS